MAAVGKRNSAAGHQLSRLRRRAPASIQISPVTEWNAVIPLLSPLVQSPTSDNPTVEIKSCPSGNKESAAATVPATATEKPLVVMKKWQHPAAPFWPFVCTGSSDR